MPRYGGHHSGMTFVHAMVSVYCLSNAMHGQNTNLPVCLFICLSVCVSVTISVNSPTGQTPHRIFTVDTLTTRRGFTQGWCAFWGYRWWIITFTGPKSPRTSILGPGLSRHFKPNMRKIQIAISSDLCVRLTWNLIGSCGQQQRLRGWSRMVVKQFQDGRPPFWKSLYRHISAKKSSDFHDTLYTAADFELDERHVIKNEKSCIRQTPSSTERLSCFINGRWY